MEEEACDGCDVEVVVVVVVVVVDGDEMVGKGRGMKGVMIGLEETVLSGGG